MFRHSTLALAAALLFNTSPAAAQEIREPELLGSLKTGKYFFTLKCAACHGDKGQGSDKGPPFLSRIYHPGHHDDRSFRRAAQNGARAHHWKFGDMPPVENLADAQLDQIIAYIRALQQKNGIF